MALALHADAPPQDPLFMATVKVPEALVRSGPSDQAAMYPTNRLGQGVVVEVMKDRGDGWLEIKPPSSSFDWINTRFLRRNDSYVWIVTTHDDAPAAVLMGSALVQDKPTVNSNKKLARGSMVIAVGQPIMDKKENDGLWLPVEPPPGEVRYIRADQVVRRPDPASGTTAATAASASAPAAPEAPPAPTAVAGNFRMPQPAGGDTGATPPASAGTTDPRWQQAQQLEQAGRTAEAADLYTQLAHDMSKDNHDFAMQCYNRAYFLRESARGGTPPAGPPADARYSATAGDSRLRPIPAGSPGQQVGYQTPPPPQMQQSNYGSTSDAAAAGPLLQSQPGRLQVAGRGVDGKRAYVLISSTGQLLMYITPQPGVDLEPYLNRNVQAYGPLVYRMELRAYHLSAQQVTPVP
jgi:hypothetical protein